MCQQTGRQMAKEGSTLDDRAGMCQQTRQAASLPEPDAFGHALPTKHQSASGHGTAHPAHQRNLTVGVEAVSRVHTLQLSLKEELVLSNCTHAILLVGRHVP